MSEETFSAIVGGFVGAIVGAVSTAVVSSYQKFMENNERRNVISAQLAREIGFVVLSLLQSKSVAAGATKFSDDDLPLKWSERISEWASIFLPSTVALVSDFKALVADTKRVHTMCVATFDFSRGHENWLPYTATRERAINTGIAAYRDLDRRSKATVRTPKLSDADLAAFKTEQMARLTREQG